MQTMHCKVLAPNRTCMLRVSQMTPVVNPVLRRCSNQTNSLANTQIRTKTRASSSEASDTAALAAGFLPDDVIIAAAEIAPVTQVNYTSHCTVTVPCSPASLYLNSSPPDFVLTLRRSHCIQRPKLRTKAQPDRMSRWVSQIHRWMSHM